jgi:ribose transport system ATP-binding protein
MNDREPLVSLIGVSKRFGPVQALDDVSFDVHRGEVHALLGENGAGKSTLIKCLAGVYRPDEGSIELDGQEVHIHNPGEAERLGIATIHQEFNLVPQLSVAENVMLGRPPKRFGFVDKKAMVAQAQEALARIGLDVDPHAPVASLGVARRQLVEIAKAISLDARILVLDEPTATLTSSETQHLMELMSQLRSQGVALVFISHHLEEITEIGDRVTVLRDGQSVSTVPATTDPGELVRLMVGRTLDAFFPRKRTAVGDVLLKVTDLSSEGEFEGISFEVRASEVVGIAGLVGAGRTEVARALFGADRYDSGSVEVDGRKVTGHSIAASMSAGIGLVPEDRKGQGLVLSATVGENLGLVTLKRATTAGFVNRRAQRVRAKDVAQRLSVRMAGLDQKVRDLSGGNQQKIVIGKWLLADSRVLILDEPTRGVDVGAKVEIYELINELTAAGRAVIVISSDLPEVLGMTDRILVMAQGRLVGELSTDSADQSSIMQLAVKEVESARVQ